jgi:hypothetical protein
MMLHDWQSVPAGTWHAFHVAWITHLSETLNGGVLPFGYYSLPEQHGGRMIADILTLQAERPSEMPTAIKGGLAVAEAPPRVQRKLSASPHARVGRRTLTIRHVSGHQVVALIEILSPSNKDRERHVAEFVDKVCAALWQGIHVLLIDVFPPGRFDANGMHGAIWERLDDQPYILPSDESLTLASYVADSLPQAYLEHRNVGEDLLDMPLFLTPDHYVLTPLRTTYQAAFHGLPDFWQRELNKDDSAD